MIHTADAAVTEVRELNQAGFGARPEYAEFIHACETAVQEGALVERKSSARGRREFWVPDMAPETQGNRTTEDHYTYRITLSEADNQYIATVAEFASLSWLDRTHEAALSGLRPIVASVVFDMQASGEKVPRAIADGDNTSAEEIG